MTADIASTEPAVRLARNDDAEFLVELSDTVFRRYLEGAAANMMRMLRNTSSETIVAVQDQTRLGFAVIHYRRLPRDFGPWSRPIVAHLDAIAVRPKLTRRGVGKLLLAHAEELARARGAISMSLLTAVENEAARALFTSAGYQLVAPLGEVYDDGQQGVSMMKPLSDAGTP